LFSLDKCHSEHIYFYHNLNQKYITKENEIKLRELLREYFEPDNFDFILSEKNVTLFYRWYEKSNIDNLQMSYITTIHKAQGSQWDNIVLILDSKKSQSNLLTDVDKQLFYTACSRTKNKLYIVYPDTINNYQLKIRDQYISPMYQSDYFGSLMNNIYSK
jgi:ATP-dependent exoDNAse (exonuclease V) alpha subunit